MSLMSVQRLEARRRHERVSGSLTENKYIPTSRLYVQVDWICKHCRLVRLIDFSMRFANDALVSLCLKNAGFIPYRVSLNEAGRSRPARISGGKFVRFKQRGEPLEHRTQRRNVRRSVA